MPRIKEEEADSDDARPGTKSPLNEDIKPHAEVDNLDSSRVTRNLRQALEDMRNPDVKVDQKLLQSDDFLLRTLGWDGISHRYAAPVPPEVVGRGFKREDITNLYGGNLQETCPKVAQKFLDRHGLNDWMYLTLNWNPHVPTKPGYPGLLFSWGRETDEWEKIQRVFVRIQMSTPALWVYIGQYQMKVGMSLTTSDWRNQTQQSRSKWAKGVLTKGWGAKLCTRLGLQKQHGVAYEPTKEDYSTSAIKENLEHYRSLLTEHDVLSAFDSGEVAMKTFKMKCIGYDGDFIRNLARHAHRYVPKPMPGKRKLRPAVDAPAPKRRKVAALRNPTKVNSDTESHDRAEQSVRRPAERPQTAQLAGTRKSSRARVVRVRTS